MTPTDKQAIIRMVKRMPTYLELMKKYLSSEELLNWCDNISNKSLDRSSDGMSANEILMYDSFSWAITDQGFQYWLAISERIEGIPQSPIDKTGDQE